MENLQLYEEIPAICQNPNCDEYKSWEMVDVEDVMDDDAGGYVYCPSCGERIDIQ